MFVIYVDTCTIQQMVILITGVQPGTSFEAIPEDWVCPLCGAAKSDFSPED